MPEVRLTWQEGLRFEAQIPHGHTMTIDSPTAGNAGPGPMSLVLVALAGCTAIDVISILQKQRQPVTSLEVVVQAERVEKHPRVYAGYEVTYIVCGSGVDRKAVERAVSLSEERYCSVSVMLRQSAPIHSSIVIEEEPIQSEGV
ncbi:MAG: OsmC family protein [Chloroflexia bacterium]|nr:OsmC family protein [Chloroflexia bacterium]